VHLCYVDDSGRDGIATFTGLLVPATGWNCLLKCWLAGRRQLSQIWHVDKHAELHANELTKKRSGRFCEPGCQPPGCTDPGMCGDDPDAADCCQAECCLPDCCGRSYFENQFGSQAVRDRAYQIMMGRLGGCPALTVTTVGCHTPSAPDAYGLFIDHLDRWAADNDTSVLVFLDGPQGPIDNSDMSPEQAKAEQEAASRNATPYRRTHRDLVLSARRVIEDPIVLDSQYNQLIQAADLAAYGAYQHLWADGQWPSGGKHGSPKQSVIKAYQQLAPRWLPDSKDGIHWAGTGA
jgi:hypothetical protein